MRATRERKLAASRVSCLTRIVRRRLARRIIAPLETVDLDGLGIQLQTLFRIDQELLNLFALVALELDHLAHLRVADDCAIASELLLDHLEDLLLVEFLGQALDGGQSLATITL